MAIGQCINENEECQGEVEARSLDMLSWFERCDFHWEARLAARENSIEKFATSDVAPDWFDPSYAGERWDDDY